MLIECHATHSQRVPEVFLLLLCFIYFVVSSLEVLRSDSFQKSDHARCRFDRFPFQDVGIEPIPYIVCIDAMFHFRDNCLSSSSSSCVRRASVEGATGCVVIEMSRHRPAVASTSAHANTDSCRKASKTREISIRNARVKRTQRKIIPPQHLGIPPQFGRFPVVLDGES